MTYLPKYENVYIPDPNTWTLAGTSPFSQNIILKINNTLYAFGGWEISSSGTSTKIWSTPWSSPTSWSEVADITGSSLGYNRSIGIINNTIYCWGTRGSTAIWSASVSSPLSWSNTGSTNSLARESPGFVITPTFIGMFGGYNGTGSSGDVAYASVSAPTSFSSIETSNYSQWNIVGCYLDEEEVYLIGGITATTRFIISSCRNASILFNGTSTNYGIEKNGALFHVGNHVWAVGNNASTNVYYGETEQLSRIWRNVDSAFPSNVQFISGSYWVGPDGYGYVINQNGNIYQSGRRLIYVTDPPLPNGLYSHRRAIDATTGESTVYTIQCQMGMAPWFTNRRDRF
jgi:hypothetical protein